MKNQMASHNIEVEEAESSEGEEDEDGLSFPKFQKVLKDIESAEFGGVIKIRDGSKTFKDIAKLDRDFYEPSSTKEKKKIQNKVLRLRSKSIAFYLKDLLKHKVDPHKSTELLAQRTGQRDQTQRATPEEATPLSTPPPRHGPSSRMSDVNQFGDFPDDFIKECLRSTMIVDLGFPERHFPILIRKNRDVRHNVKSGAVLLDTITCTLPESDVVDVCNERYKLYIVDKGQSLLFQGPTLPAGEEDHQQEVIETMKKKGKGNDTIDNADEATKAAILADKKRQSYWMLYKFEHGLKVSNKINERSDNLVHPVTALYKKRDHLITLKEPPHKTVVRGEVVRIRWVVAVEGTQSPITVQKENVMYESVVDMLSGTN